MFIKNTVLFISRSTGSNTSLDLLWFIHHIDSKFGQFGQIWPPRPFIPNLGFFYSFWHFCRHFCWWEFCSSMSPEINILCEKSSHDVPFDSHYEPISHHNWRQSFKISIRHHRWPQVMGMSFSFSLHQRSLSLYKYIGVKELCPCRLQ